MAKGKKAAAKAVKSTLEDKVEVAPEVIATPEDVFSSEELHVTEKTILLEVTGEPEEIEEIEEDIEVLPPSEPIPAEGKEWVANASILRKVEGYRDTLNGTLYLGVRK
jgi:hypothetical protein